MLSDLDKGKLKDCLARAAYYPGAKYLARPNAFENISTTIGNSIDLGYFADMDEYIAMADWAHADPANQIKSLSELHTLWQQRKLTP